MCAPKNRQCTHMFATSFWLFWDRNKNKRKGTKWRKVQNNNICPSILKHYGVAKTLIIYFDNQSLYYLSMIKFPLNNRLLRECVSWQTILPFTWIYFARKNILYFEFYLFFWKHSTPKHHTLNFSQVVKKGKLFVCKENFL